MQHPQLGAGHRAPYHLVIEVSGIVCAMTRSRQPMLRCSSCAYFQGMLVRPDPCVLCAAPTSQPRRRTRARGRASLVCDDDWPDTAPDRTESEAASSGR